MPNRERGKSGIGTPTFGRDEDDGAHDEGDDDYEDGDDDDDAHDEGDDIYIMMKCVFVCNEKSSLPPVTT